MGHGITVVLAAKIAIKTILTGKIDIQKNDRLRGTVVFNLFLSVCFNAALEQVLYSRAVPIIGR